MKKELLIPVALAGLSVLFVIVSLLVYLTRGNAYFIQRKLRIGAMILVLTAALSSCEGCPGTTTCYVPPPPEETRSCYEKEGIINTRGFCEIKHPVDDSVMINIPSGEFVMGSDKYAAEKPVQTIYLDPYYIDKYPVTNAQFRKFVDATGYLTDAEKEGTGMVRMDRKWVKFQGACWKTPDGLTGIEGKEDHPVSQVSYNDAIAYCQWAQKDLPTEAQWEKAARGTDGRVYPWGGKDPDDTLANFDNRVGSTTPVNEYEKGQSYYGLQDMAGNVYQWVKDWYATGERRAVNPTGPASGKDRVIKGGSFIEGVESLRSGNRDRYQPSHSTFIFGFRCSCTLIGLKDKKAN